MELLGLDDLHHHLRDGDALRVTVPMAAKQFTRVIVMPNLRPPITTTAMALAYRQRILDHMPSSHAFQPLMTLYLTDNTTAEEIEKAKASGHIYAVKYYPAGATTNSALGVSSLQAVTSALHAMQQHQLPLLIHGEVTDHTVDIFDREAECIQNVLRPLVQQFPQLRIVMEHITTAEAVAFVRQQNPKLVGATITPQHLLYNRNVLFEGGLRPHKYCLPVLKHERHRLALVDAIQSGETQFFMGTDSAPHEATTKESACGCAGIFSAHAAIELYATAFERAGCLQHLLAFACHNGAQFYGLPRNQGKTVLTKTPWTVPSSYPYLNGKLVPLAADETLEWQLDHQI